MLLMLGYHDQCLSVMISRHPPRQTTPRLPSKSGKRVLSCTGSVAWNRRPHGLRAAPCCFLQTTFIRIFLEMTTVDDVRFQTFN